MREKVAVILFVVILAFIAVFSAEVFHKLFIEADNNFFASASAAFFGAFLAFLFLRIAEFFKSYSDRTAKNYNALVKLEHILNRLLTSLDDIIYIIETFEGIYTTYINNPHKDHVFVWGNKLHPVTMLDEPILELLNTDLINELFALNIHLRKLNESMETINSTYAESKDALFNKQIDPGNYLENTKRTYEKCLKLKGFVYSYNEETMQALAAVRVLAKKRPLISHVLRKISGYKYGRNFNAQRSEELIKLRNEAETIKSESQNKIDKVLGEK